jgi:hypothetical protein
MQALKFLFISLLIFPKNAFNEDNKEITQLCDHNAENVPAHTINSLVVFDITPRVIEMFSFSLRLFFFSSISNARRRMS